MGVPVKKKRTGAVSSASGKTALSFKKGTPNYTEVGAAKVKKGDPLRSKPQKAKPIPGSQQTRGQNETVKEMKVRRDLYRSRKK